MANDREQMLHSAICEAVAILNVSPDVVVLENGGKVRMLLREALARYADDFMDERVTKSEREAVAKRHRSRKEQRNG